MLSTLSLEAFTNRSWILVQTILKLAKSIDHKIIFAISINSISIIIPYFEKVMIIKWKTSEDREINSYGQNSIQLLITLNSVFFRILNIKKAYWQLRAATCVLFVFQMTTGVFRDFGLYFILTIYTIYSKVKMTPKTPPKIWWRFYWAFKISIFFHRKFGKS